MTDKAETKVMEELMDSGSKEQTLVILKGEKQTIPAREKKIRVMSGDIRTVLSFLQQRGHKIKPDECHMYADKTNRMLTLHVDETNYYAGIITGKLELSDEFKLSTINTGKEFSSFELADFVKMNRHLFPDKEQAMVLVTKLRAFKAKVDQHVEKHKDDQANYKMHRSQAVESNLPRGFRMAFPIFKGEVVEVFNVEIVINPNDLSCSLLSPDAKLCIDTKCDEYLNREIKEIEALSPDLLIIHK